MTDESLTVEIRELHRKVDELVVAITGNGMGVSKGLVGCVQEQEDKIETLCTRVSALEDRWKKVMWMGSGLVLGTSGLTAWLTHIIGGG